MTSMYKRVVDKVHIWHHMENPIDRPVIRPVATITVVANSDILHAYRN